MICKDPVTLELLEEAENVTKKYEVQSGEISKSFLMSAINICSQCDLQYKESRNQRLHVELALMKIAHIRSALKLSDETLASRSIEASSEGLKKKLA